MMQRMAAKLYDKFLGFIVDMKKSGKSIESFAKSFEGAMKQT